jgi:hypothetical protein
MSYLPDDWSGEDSEDGAPARDLTWITDDELEASIPAIQRRIDALTTHLALRGAEYDRRGLARDRYVLNTAQWLAHTCRITKTQASAVLRTGRALERMPDVSEKAMTGTITTGGVRKLTAAHNRHPQAFGVHEVVLADAATYLTPKDLSRAISHWEQQVAYPDAVAEVVSKRRRLSINQTWDGMWSVSGELDPETGHTVASALKARIEPSNLDDTDDRTHSQRMADALADICHHTLTHSDTSPTSGGVKPHVTVTVDYETLVARVRDPNKPQNPLPELDGQPINPEVVRRFACDATIIPMVLGSDSEVLDVGRANRTIPTAIRRALDHRDKGCTWSGCDAPPEWCDAHHRECRFYTNTSRESR